jgi:hypothetical protein
MLAFAVILRPGSRDVFLLPALIAGTRPGPIVEQAEARVQRQVAVHRPGLLAIARATTPELAAWLAQAINLALRGEAPLPLPRGVGRFVEHGTFVVADATNHIIARAHSTPRLTQHVSIDVADCQDAAAARALAAQLNALMDL